MKKIIAEIWIKLGTEGRIEDEIIESLSKKYEVVKEGDRQYFIIEKGENG